MAASLQRRALPFARTLLSPTRSLSSDAALVELKPGEIGIVSGIPQEHLHRKVMIYSPARTATQQGSGKVGRWKINFMSTQKWENPLMGWTSTGDPYANVGDAALSFDSEEAAKAFAEKHGWDYVVRKHHTPLLQVEENISHLIQEEVFSIIVALARCNYQPIRSVPIRSKKPKAYADNFKWKGPPKNEEE